MSISDFTQYIDTAGLILLAAAIWYSQWRSGAKQVSSEVIANYAALDKQQKEQISRYEQELGKVTEEMRNMEKGLIAKIAKLEGTIQEKDRQLTEANRILANRNPELEKVLGEIRDFMKQLTEKNDKQTQMLETAVQSNGHQG